MQQSAMVDSREMVSWENRLLSWWLVPEGETAESVSAVESKALRAPQSWVSDEEPVPGALPSLVVSIWLPVLLEELLVLSVMSGLVFPSGISFHSLYYLSIFCLSSFTQALEQYRLRKALKVWHQKFLMLNTTEPSPKHSHETVCEEPLALLCCEDLSTLSTSSGFHSSATATLASQSSLEKVRMPWYRASLPLHSDWSDVLLKFFKISASTWDLLRNCLVFRPEEPSACRALEFVSSEIVKLLLSACSLLHHLVIWGTAELMWFSCVFVPVCGCSVERVRLNKILSLRKLEMGICTASVMACCVVLGLTIPRVVQK